MKDLLNLKGVKTLSKLQQKSIKGSAAAGKCYPGGDPECCGTASWQCGVGPNSGGIYLSPQCCGCF